MVCPSDKRFMLLFTFVKKNKDKKCMVFFSTCSSVKYHAELFNYIDIPVKDIHVGVLNLRWNLPLILANFSVKFWFQHHFTTFLTSNSLKKDLDFT